MDYLVLAWSMAFGHIDLGVINQSINQSIHAENILVLHDLVSFVSTYKQAIVRGYWRNLSIMENTWQ